MRDTLAPPPKAARTTDSRSRLMASARKLFVERGFHGTRPQDITREAGLGHGTFYLHFPDKRACFLAFVEEARVELDEALRVRLARARTPEEAVRASLEAIFDYGLTHPGVLLTAMADVSVIAAEGAGGPTLVDRWAAHWAETLTRAGLALPLDAELAGAAIVGIIQQGSAWAARRALPAQDTIDALTHMIVRALKP
jgi:AcrR family transcriptional regulator